MADTENKHMRGAPPIDPGKKRNRGYVLNYAKADKAAIAAIAFEHGKKPVEIIREAVRLLLESQGDADIAAVVAVGKADKLASTYLNLTAAEDTAICSAATKRDVTKADILRSAIQTYIASRC